MVPSCRDPISWRAGRPGRQGNGEGAGQGWELAGSASFAKLFPVSQNISLSLNPWELEAGKPRGSSSVVLQLFPRGPALLGTTVP